MSKIVRGRNERESSRKLARAILISRPAGVKKIRTGGALDGSLYAADADSPKQSVNCKRVPALVGVLLLSLLLALLAACEVDTRLTIRGNPADFIISGSGTLGALRVLGPKRQRKSGDPAVESTYWEILPEKGHLNGRPITALEHVTYGEIPVGYVQVYPEQGEAPTLIEGEHYQVWLRTVNANGASKQFTIRDGKAVEEVP